MLGVQSGKFNSIKFKAQNQKSEPNANQSKKEIVAALDAEEAILSNKVDTDYNNLRYQQCDELQDLFSKQENIMEKVENFFERKESAMRKKHMDELLKFSKETDKIIIPFMNKYEELAPEEFLEKGKKYHEEIQRTQKDPILSALFEIETKGQSRGNDYLKKKD